MSSKETRNVDPGLSEAGLDSRAWPFDEARKLIARLEKTGHSGEAPVLFETGFGASGLPHVGTFGEVVRTTMVRHAFEVLSDRPTRLVVFSDDMDGLRKVPGNIPNPEKMEPHLGKPITDIPDPFGTHESFGAHNNARLRSFLDTFGFDYEFLSATECYTSGRFDPVLLEILKHYDDVIKVILPTLGEERRATYSPFLPVCEETGVVLQVPVVERDVAAGVIVYEREDGEKIETPVTGGRCKMQWKADWAMRWRALEVDYEMYGKDLIESAKLSSRICRIIGGAPPEGFNFELFLDAEGAKISKSRGNSGITVEDWLRYAPQESLSLFMYQSPRKAKRLFFDVIPRYMDDYVSFIDKYHSQDLAEQLKNPVWHIHGGYAPQEDLPLSYSMLLNLVSASNSEDREVLWGFIRNYDGSASPENHPLLDQLVDCAINYFHDFIKPEKRYRVPTPEEKTCLEDLKARLEALSADSPAEDIQSVIFEVGKSHGYENLREWFAFLYEVLLGQTQGPRFGSFVAIYGIPETIDLIGRVLAGESLGASA